MYISYCLYYFASFSALAMRELADVKADSSGIQALGFSHTEGRHNKGGGRAQKIS